MGVGELERDRRGQIQTGTEVEGNRTLDLIRQRLVEQDIVTGQDVQVDRTELIESVVEVEEEGQRVRIEGTVVSVIGRGVEEESGENYLDIG